jgi:23S rRNA (guanosine2251-2'-O)-methyltransferase
VNRERERPRDQRRSSGAGARLVAGRRAVTEAIRSGAAYEVLVIASPKPTQGMRSVMEAAELAGVALSVVPRAKLDQMAAEHQGVVARIGAPTRGGSSTPELSERDLADLPFTDDAIVVILDGITDPQNLGAAARSAESAGAEVLVTRTKRAADVTSAAIRASAGALLHLPHARVANIARAIERLQAAGFWVVGLDQAAPHTIYDEACPPGRIALVVGSEGEGMARLTRERCDALVSLPARGKVKSLNASASLAAALYGYVLASRPPPPPVETARVDSAEDAGVAQSGSASDL